jgi:hypothetical protein
MIWPDLWLPLTIICGTVLYAVSKFTGISPSNVDELTPLLRPVNVALLSELLDPTEEAKMRSAFPSPTHVHEQRKRMQMAHEQLCRMLRNSRLIGSWSGCERERIAGEKNPSRYNDTDVLIVSVLKVSHEVRRQTLHAILRLAVWRFFLVFAELGLFWVPTLSEIREVGGRDVVMIYEDLTSAAAELILMYGADRYERLIAAL